MAIDCSQGHSIRPPHAAQRTGTCPCTSRDAPLQTQRRSSLWAAWTTSYPYTTPPPSIEPTFSHVPSPSSPLPTMPATSAASPSAPRICCSARRAIVARGCGTCSSRCRRTLLRRLPAAAAAAAAAAQTLHLCTLTLTRTPRCQRQLSGATQASACHAELPSPPPPPPSSRARYVCNLTPLPHHAPRLTPPSPQYNRISVLLSPHTTG